MTITILTSTITTTISITITIIIMIIITIILVFVLLQCDSKDVGHLVVQDVKNQQPEA